MRGILLALLAEGGEGRRAGLCIHPFYCPKLGQRTVLLYKPPCGFSVVVDHEGWQEKLSLI